ncbi:MULTISPECIES: hypothetical protein, partial [unclassified Sulfitobacter]
MISAMFLTAFVACPVDRLGRLHRDRADKYLLSVSETRDRVGPDAEITRGTQTGEPGLAFGLNGIKDYATQQPFIDVMNTSRPWIGHREG